MVYAVVVQYVGMVRLRGAFRVPWCSQPAVDVKIYSHRAAHLISGIDAYDALLNQLSCTGIWRQPFR